MANKLMFIVSCAILVACSSAAITGRKDECAPDCREQPEGKLYSHPQNCNLFYQCSHGHAVQHTCGEGLEFSDVADACLYPYESGCTSDPTIDCSGGSVTTEAPATTTSSGAGGTTSTVPTTTPGTTVAPSEVCVPPCPSTEALYPDPRDCNKFFQCAHGVPHHHKCLPYLHYSMVDERCETPANAGCTAGPDAPCEAVTRPPPQ